MASPFDKLTETDELRSSIRVRDFENKLAESNAAIFDKETKMLALDEAKARQAERVQKQNAQSAFSASVLSKAQSPDDVERLTRDFMASNPSQAQYAPELVKNANEMFSSSNAARSSALTLAQQKRSDQIAEENHQQMRTIAADSLALKEMQTEQERSKIEAERVKAIADPLDKMNSYVDITSKDQVTLQKSILEKANQMLDQSEKARYYETMGSVFKANKDFSRFRDKFAQQTVEEYGTEITNLRKDASIQTDFQKWYDANAQTLKAEKLPESAYFTRFIAESAKNADIPESVGDKIESMGSRYSDLLARARMLNRARETYTAFQTNVINASGELEPGIASLYSGALSRTMDDMTEQMKSRIDSNKQILSDRQKAANIRLTEQRASESTARERILQGQHKELSKLRQQLDSRLKTRTNLQEGRGAEAKNANAIKENNKQIEVIEAKINDIITSSQSNPMLNDQTASDQNSNIQPLE